MGLGVGRFGCEGVDDCRGGGSHFRCVSPELQPASHLFTVSVLILFTYSRFGGNFGFPLSYELLERYLLSY